MAHIKLFENWLNEATINQGANIKKTFMEAFIPLADFAMDGETEVAIGSTFLLAIGLGDLTDYGTSNVSTSIASSIDRLMEEYGEEEETPEGFDQKSATDAIISTASKLSDTDKTELFDMFADLYCASPSNKCSVEEFNKFKTKGEGPVNSRWFGDQEILDNLLSSL